MTHGLSAQVANGDEHAEALGHADPLGEGPDAH